MAAVGAGAAQAEGPEDGDEGVVVPFEAQRKVFVREVGRFERAAGGRVAEVLAKSRAMEDAAQQLLEYFGADAREGTAKVLSTLSRFLKGLAAAKAAYERRHGRITTEDLPVVVGQQLATAYGHGSVCGSVWLLALPSCHGLAVLPPAP
jgi:hypothetical protein